MPGQVVADVLGKSEEHDASVLMALDRVPASMWQSVTPQLFSYLTHPKVHNRQAPVMGTHLYPCEICMWGEH